MEQIVERGCTKARAVGEPGARRRRQRPAVGGAPGAVPAEGAVVVVAPRQLQLPVTEAVLPEREGGAAVLFPVEIGCHGRFLQNRHAGGDQGVAPDGEVVLPVERAPVAANRRGEGAARTQRIAEDADSERLGPAVRRRVRETRTHALVHDVALARIDLRGPARLAADNLEPGGGTEVCLESRGYALPPQAVLVGIEERARARVGGREAVGLEMRSGGEYPGAAARARRDARPARVVGPGAERGLDALRPTGEDLDHAADGIGTVQARPRTAHDLDALDLLE